MYSANICAICSYAIGIEIGSAVNISFGGCMIIAGWGLYAKCAEHGGIVRGAGANLEFVDT